MKFENGLCGIHKTLSEHFLSDACHFYPRITRKAGDATVMSASMSCPEIARLALFNRNASHLGETTIERLPHTINQCTPQSLSAEDALAIHHIFITTALDESISAQRAFARISRTARSLD